jgi:predicted nucleotidyltransferase
MNELKNWLLETFEKDTCAIMLVGSRARGINTEKSDVDILIVEDTNSTQFRNLETKYKEYDLDIWIRSLDSIKTQLSKSITDANQLLNTSLVISLLKDATIWYEKGNCITPLISIAKSWKWSAETEKLLWFEKRQPTTEWALNAYNEDWQLIDLARERIAKNKPISNRRKDYPELLITTNRQEAIEAFEAMQEAYTKLGMKRKWTEFKDAVKAIQNENYAKTIASIKDVLKFIVRIQLSHPPEQLLDPSLWNRCEEENLPEETNYALRTVF